MSPRGFPFLWTWTISALFNAVGSSLIQGCAVRWHQNNGRSASDESPVPEMLSAFGSGTY